MRLTFSIAGAHVDLRVLSLTALGCSIVYGRFDVATHTIAMLDVERVNATHRTTPIEALVRFGPLVVSNRSWYFA